MALNKKDYLAESTFGFKSVNAKDSYSEFKNYLLSPNPPASFENYFKKNIINKLKRHRFLIIITHRSFAPYEDEWIQQNIINEKIYRKQALSYLLTSKISANSRKIAARYMRSFLNVKSKNWEVYIFTPN
jgi:hypothetical protein